MPRLASTFRLLAPDLPGFGFTEVPAGRDYHYSFNNLALTIDAFVQTLNLTRYALYVFDYQPRRNGTNPRTFQISFGSIL